MKSAEEAASEGNTLVLKLNATCRRERDRVVNDKVYSKDFVWLPGGSEMPDETSCRCAFYASFALDLPPFDFFCLFPQSPFYPSCAIS